jgi:gliding motility-associated-like protein
LKEGITMQITSTSRVVACVTILLGNLPLSAQILDYYYTFQSTDTWTELTGDQVVFSGAFDDEVSAAIPLLPTTMGVEPHTSLFISTNGFMTLSAAPSTSNYDPLSQGISAPVIAPFATNLEGVDATSKVSYTIDTQGIYVQWKNVRRAGYVGESFSFQARIISQVYTGFGFGSISFIYGPFQGVAEPSTSVHVGIRVGSGDTAGTFATRTVAPGSVWSPDTFGVSSTSTCAFPSTTAPDGFPATGMKQQWFLNPGYPGQTNSDVSPLCNGNGNVVIYSNYDGGTLNINVDQDIPNLKIGICTYEPVEVNISGPFASNVVEVLYAGFNSAQGNNNCGLGIPTTSISGVDPSVTQILTAPQVGYEPLHGNGSGGWGGLFSGPGLMVGVSGQCDTLYVAGGGNTPDEVVFYFLTAFDGDLLFHHTQYDCWFSEIYDVSEGGNCCVNPLTPTWTITVPNDTAVCYGETLALALLQNQSGQGPFAYEWTYNTVPVCTEDSCNVTAIEDGQACVTVTNVNGQTLSDCFDVSVDASIDVMLSASDTALCMPAQFILTNETDPSTFASQQWTIDGTPYPDQSSVTFTPIQPGVFDIALEVSTANGCVYDTLLTEYIEAFEQPIADYTTDPLFLETDDTDVTLIDVSQGDIETWEWTVSFPAQELTSMDQSPTFSLPLGVAGSYPLQLAVTSSNGCSDFINGAITVNGPFNLYVPSAFTPNGDGINDVFFVEGTAIDAAGFQLAILNRWGEVVHSSTDPREVWMGGAMDGEFYVPDGVYSYTISANSSKAGERFEYRGYISIIR